MIVLLLNGRAQLLLEGVTRFPDGSIKTADVVNGAWRFERKDGEVLCKGNHGYIVNRYPDPGYTEVPAPQGRDYNEIMRKAEHEAD